MTWFKKAEEAPQSQTEHTESEVVRQYLETMLEMKKQCGVDLPQGFLYWGLEDFLLQHGRKYASAQLSQEELALLRKVVRKDSRFVAKQCFYNAQTIALASHGGIDYVEGVAYCKLIPMDHAWNAINGKVVDLTWRGRNDEMPIMGIIPTGWEYWGVALPHDSVRRYWNRFGESNAMLQNHRERHPLFRKKFEPKTTTKL